MTLMSRRALLTLPAVAVPKRKRRRCKVGMQPDEQGVFFQLIIQGGGEFTYDAAGNLRTANVGQTTTDPLQGITCYAGFSTFNGFGAIISLFSSTLDAQLWYTDTGSSSQGSLIASIASKAGTDPFSNAYSAGVTSYTSLSFAQMFGGNLVIGDVGAAGVASSLFSGNTVRNGNLFIGSGKNATLDLQAFINLLGDPSTPGVIFENSTSGTRLTTAMVEDHGSLAVGPSLGSIREWYAPSGGDDFAALNTALSSYGSADLLPGAYSLSAQLNIAGAALQGCDMATVIQPFSGYAGVLVQMGGQSSMRNLSLQSGGSDAVRIASGVAEWWLEDLFFASNAGFCINANSVTAPTHGRIRGIRGSGGGSANGGGIAINGGTGAAITAEVNIYDVDIQNCTTSEVLFLSSVTDVLAFEVNGGIKSGVAANGVTIQGACQTCSLSNFDVGGGAGTGVLVFQDAGGHSSSEIQIASGKFQAGAVGVVVNGAAARLGFTNVFATRNQGDGFQWNGTGAFNTMTACVGNTNNQAAGVAYDVNITSTAHLLMNGFAGVSGAVTASRNITLAGNHVTSVNEPASNTSAGNAPAGW